MNEIFELILNIFLTSVSSTHSYSIHVGILAPSSALPIGAKRKVDSCKLFPVEMTRANLRHRILALTHARLDPEVSDELEFGDADALTVFPTSLNVAAFLWVTEVDEEKQRLTLLSPLSLPQIKTNVILIGEAPLSWQE